MASNGASKIWLGTLGQGDIIAASIGSSGDVGDSPALGAEEAINGERQYFGRIGTGWRCLHHGVTFTQAALPPGGAGDIPGHFNYSSLQEADAAPSAYPTSRCPIHHANSNATAAKSLRCIT